MKDNQKPATTIATSDHDQKFVKIQKFESHFKGKDTLTAVVPRRPPIEKIFALVLLKIILGLQALNLRFRSLNSDDDIEIQALLTAGFVEVGVGDAKYNDRLLPNGRIAGSDTEVVAFGLRLHERLEGLCKEGKVLSPEAKQIRALLKLVEYANVNNETGDLKDSGMGGNPWTNDMIAFLLRKAYDVWSAERGHDDPFHPSSIIRKSMHVVETCIAAALKEEPRQDEPSLRLQNLFASRLNEEGDVRRFCLGHYAWAMWQCGATEEEIDERLSFWYGAQQEIEVIYRQAKARKLEIIRAEIQRGVSTETAENLMDVILGQKNKGIIDLPKVDGDEKGDEVGVGRIMFGPKEEYMLLAIREPNSTVVSELWGDERVGGEKFEAPNIIVNEQFVEDENGGAPLGIRFAIMTKNGMPFHLEDLRDAIREMAFDEQRAQGVPEDKLVDPCHLEYRRGGELNRLFINGSDFWDRPWHVKLTLPQVVKMLLQYIRIGDATPKSESLPIRKVTPNILETLAASLSAGGKTWSDRRPNKKS